MGVVQKLVRPEAMPPTQAQPKWRLRVFDLCWPWRATWGEALADALDSGNASYDPEDRTTYLDAAAAIQRNPPFDADRIRHEQRCRERGVTPLPRH